MAGTQQPEVAMFIQLSNKISGHSNGPKTPSFDYGYAQQTI